MRCKILTAMTVSLIVTAGAALVAASEPGSVEVQALADSGGGFGQRTELGQIMAKLDASGIGGPRLTQLPISSVEFDFSSRFQPQNVAAILAPGEHVDVIGPLAGVEQAVSQNFVYEKDDERCRFLMLRTEAANGQQGGEVSGGLILSIASEQLDLLGIPRNETVRTHTRRLMRASRSNGSSEVKGKAVGHKVFVERSLGGIPVLGHGLILSYDLDGTYRKIIGRWPTLAPNGHRLHTNLPPDAITEIVAAELIRQGKHQFEGRAPIGLVYEPVRRPDGRIRLVLKVEVVLDAGRVTGDGKLRTLLVDLPS